MTALVTRGAGSDDAARLSADRDAEPATGRRSAGPGTLAVEAPPAPLAPARVALLAWLWVGVTIACLAFVLLGLEPLFQQREQRLLLEQQRSLITKAANEAGGLPGIEVPTKSPGTGSPVGVLEIGGLQVQQVVVEGVGAAETQVGPGHVPGTAGLGQPGNSVVVARRAMFGGPFADLALLHEGDLVLATTTQGQSVYRVRTVREQELVAGAVAGSEAEAVATGNVDPDPADASDPAADPLSGDRVAVDDLYGPTEDDRLTLVTSADVLPWSADRAVVVTAELVGPPYTPTPQGGRTDDQTGRTGDASAWSAAVLALLLFGGAAVSAVLLYRRTSARTAYLLTAAPFLVAAILLAESLSRLLPAWA